MKRKKKEPPHAGSCSFCGDGLLRFLRCGGCESIVACCDECELIWADLAAVTADPEARSSGAYPDCPVCREKEPKWTRLSAAQVRKANLGEYIK